MNTEIVGYFFQGQYSRFRILAVNALSCSFLNEEALYASSSPGTLKRYAILKIAQAYAILKIAQARRDYLKICFRTLIYIPKTRSHCLHI